MTRAIKIFFGLVAAAAMVIPYVIIFDQISIIEKIVMGGFVLFALWLILFIVANE